MRSVKEMIGCHSRAVIEEGLCGRGVTAAVLDTGAALHPDLMGKLIGWKDVLHGRSRPYDDNGHGTHVAGILAGSGSAMQGRYAGVAPGASLVCVKVLDQDGNGQIDQVVEGIRYVLSQRERLRIRIVNISIGTRPHPGDLKESRLLYWVERLWDSGLVVVTAAGNLGPQAGSITLPGVDPKVITVGACDMIHDCGGRSGNAYSGCGPTADCIVKPDVSAPGNGVLSCNYRFPRYSRLPYIRKSGTSMATPVVSGAVALLLEKYPEMSNVEVKLRLWNCCTDVGCPENVQGHGRICLERLLS